jgi:hypothetical protein
MKALLNLDFLPLAKTEMERSCHISATATWDPPLTDMDFTGNCTAVALFIHTLLSNPYNAPSIVDYVRGGLPSSGLSQATYGRIMDWFVCSYGNASAWYDGNGEMYEILVAKPYAACEAEVCNLIQWSGNADIAGRGVC